MNVFLLNISSIFVVACLVSLNGCDRLTKSHAIQSPQPNEVATSGEPTMNQDRVWNDEAREVLRVAIRSRILGELRLAKCSHEEILQTCREVYIDNDCPENEQAIFIQVANDELRRAKNQLEAEKSIWRAETDCDRLDRVEAALRERGIILWQVSPCCDPCTLAELSDRIELINNRHPGFKERLRGYAFFIDQNMPDMLADGTELSVYLAYGWISPDRSSVADDIYKQNALGIAREICECLRNEDLEVNWNGVLSNKIGLSLNWQRRKMLE